MRPTAHIERSHTGPATTGLDVAQWVELAFPSVEELLHRLIETENAKRTAVRSSLFGSRKLATLCAIGFIWVPGCATATAVLLVTSNSVPTPTVHSEPVPAKADRLAVNVPIAMVNHFDDFDLVPLDVADDEANSPEQPALRGTVEDLTPVMAASEPPAAPRRKLQRSARLAFDSMPAESPAPPSRSPSLLERLFSVLVPQFSQPLSQRQT